MKIKAGRIGFGLVDMKYSTAGKVFRLYTNYLEYLLFRVLACYNTV